MADTLTNDSSTRRQAAIMAMHKFAFENGIERPVVREELRDDVIAFIGAAQDGREYAFGYVRGEGEAPSEGPFPEPPACFRLSLS